VYIAHQVEKATSNPALFDQGSARVWQNASTVASVTNGRIIQPGTNTAGCFRAVGVDASGDGIATRPYANGGTCPTFANITNPVNAAITLRAFGPGGGSITAGVAPAFQLIKSTGSNGVVRLTQNRVDGVETYLIAPASGSTLQIAPAGCSTLSAATYPLAFPNTVTCTVNAGFGARNITAIFDTPGVP